MAGWLVDSGNFVRVSLQHRLKFRLYYDLSSEIRLFHISHGDLEYKTLSTLWFNTRKRYLVKTADFHCHLTNGDEIRLLVDQSGLVINLSEQPASPGLGFHCQGGRG